MCTQHIIPEKQPYAACVHKTKIKQQNIAFIIKRGIKKNIVFIIKPKSDALTAVKPLLPWTFIIRVYYEKRKTEGHPKNYS